MHYCVLLCQIASNRVIPSGLLSIFAIKIPNDPQKPGITSGVRIGTPAVTTRGLNEADMDVIAECMALIAADPEGNNEAVKAKVKALTDKYPLYA